VSIDAEVELNVGDDSYFLRTRLNVSLPGSERVVARNLIDEAEKIRPFAKATRGNVEVAIKLV
jgi:lipoyl-dependent peroxiredoxin